MSRPIYILLGFVSLGLGIIGAFLPVMPTTCFIILSAYCFSKSSSRLENWLLSHPKWGPIVLNWRLYRSIPHKAKALAVLGMSISAIIIYFGNVSIYFKLIAWTVLVISGAYVLTRPSKDIIFKTSDKV